MPVLPVDLIKITKKFLNSVYLHELVPLRTQFLNFSNNLFRSWTKSENSINVNAMWGFDFSSIADGLQLSV